MRGCTGVGRIAIRRRGIIAHRCPWRSAVRQLLLRDEEVLRLQRCHAPCAHSSPRRHDGKEGTYCESAVVLNMHLQPPDQPHLQNRALNCYLVCQHAVFGNIRHV